jgi:hypothetical protein
LGSVTGASVSMLAVRRGAKKLLIVNFTASGGTVAFLGVRATSPVECRFRLQTSLKTSACFVFPAWLLTFRTFFSSLSVTAP